MTATAITATASTPMTDEKHRIRLFSGLCRRLFLTGVRTGGDGLDGSHSRRRSRRPSGSPSSVAVGAFSMVQV